MKKTFLFALFIALISMSCGNKTGKTELKTEETVPTSEVKTVEEAEPEEQEVEATADSCATADQDSLATEAQPEETTSAE